MRPGDFDRFAAKTRLKADARAMARRILVDGLTAAAAGQEFGKTRSEADRAARRVRTVAVQEHSCPCCGQPM